MKYKSLIQCYDQFNERNLSHLVSAKNLSFLREEKPERETNYSYPTYDLDESIRGSKTDQKKCFQGYPPLDPLVWQTREERRRGKVHNSISSRWPPIKADEWEPFNGPSVNLHPWPLYLSSYPFSTRSNHPPTTHSPSLEQGTFLPLSLSRGDTSFLSRVSLLVNDARSSSLLHDETCPWIPSSFSLQPPSSNLPRATSRVSRGSETCLCYSSTEREQRTPPSRILSNVSIEFRLPPPPQRFFSTLFRVSILSRTEGYTIFAAMIPCKFDCNFGSRYFERTRILPRERYRKIVEINPDKFVEKKKKEKEWK